MNNFPLGVRLLAAWLVLASTTAGCAMLGLAPEPPARPPVETAGPDARAAAIEAFALRLRDADRAELLDEWRLAQRAPQPARTALLKLHPESPVYDVESALQLLDAIDADERRAVLRGWNEILTGLRQSDARVREQAERTREQADRAREQAERTREQLAAQAERQRTQLRDAERRALDDRQRIEQERVKTDQERQRADLLAARLEELQRTMQALRDIDRRQVNRTP